MTKEGNVFSGERTDRAGFGRLVALVMIAILGAHFAQAPSFKPLHPFTVPAGALPPASLSQVRAAASSAVPSGSHRLGTAAPSAQSGGPVGWHDISTCNHHWRTADGSRRAPGDRVFGATSDRDGNAGAADTAGEATCAARC